MIGNVALASLLGEPDGANACAIGSDDVMIVAVSNMNESA
jgi:hypothetical protein